MANQTFSLSANTVSTVAANEGTLSGLKGDAKMVTEQVNATKLATYAELISAISGIALTDKGNLPRSISKTVNGDLTTDGGCKDATAKKYLENSVAAKRKFGFGDNTTPTAVMALFNDQGITSEAKLAKAVSPDDGKTAAEILAEKVIGKWSTKKENGKVVQGDKWKDGLTDAELVDFFDALRILEAERATYHANADAAKEAGKAVEKENDTVNDVVDQI